MIIRRMTLSDVDAVHQIETASFHTPWTRQDFVEEMTVHPFARYMVAEEDGEVIAYAGAWLVPGDDSLTEVDGHITNVAVRPDRRGRGVGEAVLRALMQVSANLGADYLTLEVRRSNLPAQGLYHKLGFVDLGIRKRYYEDNGEDALLLVCDRLPKADEEYSE